MGEEELGIAMRAEVHSLHFFDARFAERAIRGAPQIEVPAAQHIRPVGSGEGLGDVGPHLVAARPDRGTDRRVQPASERPGPLGNDPSEQSAPADSRAAACRCCNRVA